MNHNLINLILNYSNCSTILYIYFAYKNVKNIFGNRRVNPLLSNKILSDIPGMMVAQNLGHGKVEVKKSFTAGDGMDLIFIYLKK